MTASLASLDRVQLRHLRADAFDCASVSTVPSLNRAALFRNCYLTSLLCSCVILNLKGENRHIPLMYTHLHTTNPKTKIHYTRLPIGIFLPTFLCKLPSFVTYYHKQLLTHTPAHTLTHTHTLSLSLQPQVLPYKGWETLLRKHEAAKQHTSARSAEQMYTFHKYSWKHNTDVQTRLLFMHMSYLCINNTHMCTQR